MTIADHTFRVSLLPRLGANILDLGCRGFCFEEKLSPKHNVCNVDIDLLDSKNYLRAGVSHMPGRCSVEPNADPQAVRIKEGGDIPMMTIEEITNHFGVDKWHLIKMDIEGAELDILKHAKHPMADQITVEFHAHRGQSKQEIDDLLNNLKQYYYIFNNHWQDKHCAGFNYWDVLFIAK